MSSFVGMPARWFAFVGRGAIGGCGAGLGGCGGDNGFGGAAAGVGRGADRFAGFDWGLHRVGEWGSIVDCMRPVVKVVVAGWGGDVGGWVVSW